MEPSSTQLLLSLCWKYFVVRSEGAFVSQAVEFLGIHEPERSPQTSVSLSFSLLRCRSKKGPRHLDEQLLTIRLWLQGKYCSFVTNS